MSANLKILVPDGTTNYIENPALHYDTTGYNAVGSAISRALNFARFGIASLQVITNGAVLREGVYYRVSSLAGVNEPITVSAYVRGAGSVRIRLIANPTGNEWASRPITLRTDVWQRIQVSGFSIGSNDVRLYIETDGKAQAVTFYVDGCQMERKPYATTYCDGDQPGCVWNVVDNGSISTRDPHTRAGGKWVPLAGACRDNDDIYVTVLSGLGMPPIANQVQSWALAPGSFYQNTKIQNRVVTLSFNIKKENPKIFRGVPDLSPLHKLRQQLVDVLKPDKTAGGEPFLFSYQVGDRELFIWLRYEAGLEGQWDIRNQWTNSFPIRLLAVDPFFFEDSLDAKKLEFYSREVSGRVMQKTGGLWKTMNYGANNGVVCFAIGKKGEIYAGGFFTIVNNNALAVDPLRAANNIAMWDGTKWNALGNGLNAQVKDIAVAPNGDLYAVGQFTVAGVVAANYVAKWDGSAWSALGSGASAQLTCVDVAPNGDVYIGGTFTSAGGITVHNVARWDGAWHSMGNYIGLNSGLFDIKVSRDGTKVYIAGAFTDEFGLAANNLKKVCYYDPATNLFVRMGIVNGFNNDCYGIMESKSGKVYVGGQFTAYGATVIKGAAVWNGNSWYPFGSGSGFANLSSMSAAIVRKFHEFSDGSLLAFGNFLFIDGIPTLNIALWNGSVWSIFDSDGLGGNDGNAVIDSEDGVYLGAASPVGHGAATTVINTGTTETKPVIYLRGYGFLRWLENLTAKKRIYLNLTVMAGEEVIIDLGKGTIQSSTRGSLYSSILPGSDFGDFSLLPGENIISCYMTNDVDAMMYMYWQPQHWSGDASTTPEELS